MRRRRSLSLAMLVSVAALIVVAFAAAPAQAVLVHDFDFGGSGTAGDKFFNPAGVAVNNTTGDVYVVDNGNNRVSQFTAAGAFIRTWGFDVISPGKPNDNGITFEKCDTTAGNVAADCKAGQAHFSSGAFEYPIGIAIDNSNGPAAGSVYVADAHNLRIQRFDADGDFVLMWGEGVNQTTGGDVCPRPGNPGDICQIGAVSNQPPGFSNAWLGNGAFGNRLTVDSAGNVYATDGSNFACSTPCGARLVKYDPEGTVLSKITENPGVEPRPFISPTVLAADADNNIYTGQFYAPTLQKFPPSEFTQSGLTSGADVKVPHYGEGVVQLAVDPTNQYLLVADYLVPSPCQTVVGKYQYNLGEQHVGHVIEYSPSGEIADCTPPTTPGMELLDTEDMTGIAVSPAHKLYMSVPPEVHVFDVPVASPPAVDSQVANNITTDSARLSAQVSANLASTTYRVEYGTSPCSELPNPCASTAEIPAGASLLPQTRGTQLNGLDPNTKYYYRFVVTSGKGSDVGPDKTFKTYEDPVFDPTCPNNLARQQTGAGLLLDCRAYELVSAPDQGGYNVESNLVAGQTPFGGYPQARDRVLYAIHNGGVPGTGKPTNRGADPYLATRDAADQRWDTTYVGVPADAPSLAAFSSTLAGADVGLDTFAFAGPDICNPCFPDGSAGIPIRTPDGELVQGMVGSMPVTMPVPAGGVKKHFSSDGNHFLFSSEQLFEPEGNPEDGNVTIYDRNLDTDATQVVSTLPDGSTIANGTDVAALDVSSDGSRILIGNRASTDIEGNDYYDLYMHAGSAAQSIEIANTAGGVRFAGMTSDGSQVFFTSRDNLADDTDSSIDLFRATISGGAATVERVSTGEGSTGDINSCDPAANSFNTKDWNAIPGAPTDCSVLAIGGGGGVASDSGSVYFLSPEQLDGSGTVGAPNLFLARPGDAPQFVATLESSLSKPLTPAIHPFLRSFGDFDNAGGVAIDHDDQSTYVYDPRFTFGEEPGEPGPGAVVKKFDAAGNLDPSFGENGTLDGSNSPGGSLGAIGFPFGNPYPVGVPAQVAVDNSSSPSAGDLYVPDLLDESIKKFDSSGNYLSKISPGAKGLAVAVSPVNGNLYVGLKTGSGANARIYNPSGGVVKLGTVLTGASGILAIAVDSANHLYVAGETSTRVYNATTLAFISTLYAGTSYGVAVDATDNHVYVDTGTSVIEFNPAGAQVGAPFAEDFLSKPQYFAADSAGLAADSGGLKVSNLGDEDIVVFGPRAVQPDRGFDSPLVLDSAREPATRHSADFQLTPSGDFAAFGTTLPLDGFDATGHYELFRYGAAGGPPVCASCTTTGQPPLSDAALASDGLSVTEDGRLFFNTAEALTLRDANQKIDVYEWSPQLPADVPGGCDRSDGCVELVSTGKDRTGAGLLSVSSDGTDAFFFTRETLAANDSNGNVMKLYTARAGGGFFIVPPAPKCVASDECHGPGSQAPEPAALGSLKGTGGNEPPLHCRKGQVKRGGKCAKKPRKRHGKHARKRRHARQGKSG
jgi:NHL repeat